MAFDTPAQRGRRVAVIGGGISGLAAAHLMAGEARVTLFEAEPRLGGHARTVLAGKSGLQPVDTGFIVFNYANYPHLTRLFHELDVPVAKSEMSFGVSVDDGAVEYGLHTLAALIGQKRNLMRPGYYRMMRDILRFNAGAEAAAKPGQSIGDLMESLRLGDWFRRYYLLPVCGAIWSSAPEQIVDFPAQSLLRFFRNHALLSHRGQHQWWTVEGGSVEYVRRLTQRLQVMGVDLRAGAGVAQVIRRPGDCIVMPQRGQPEAFDDVIFACHSDQALRLLAAPTAAERQVLGAIRYQDNRMVLHADARQMPRQRACWSAWVYKADQARLNGGVGVTYWMNRLQNIPESDPLFVTLNPARPVDPRLIYDEAVFRHPVFDQAAVAAQARLAEVQGVGGCWFAGAYTRFGFHEDGIASAHRVVRAMKARVLA